MLILGDSFGWGYGVEHHERFSKILEDAHPDWEIINASVTGFFSTTPVFLCPFALSLLLGFTYLIGWRHIWLEDRQPACCPQCSNGYRSVCKGSSAC